MYRFVGRNLNEPIRAYFDRGLNDIQGAKNVRVNRFYRVRLKYGHVFMGRSVEHYFGAEALEDFEEAPQEAVGAEHAGRGDVHHRDAAAVGLERTQDPRLQLVKSREVACVVRAAPHSTTSAQI